MRLTKARSPRPALAQAGLIAAVVCLPAWAGAAPQATPSPSPSASPSPDAPRYEEKIEVEGRLAIPAEATTATKIAVPLEKLPVSVSAVGGALLEAQDARVLGDALRNVAGVNPMPGFGVFDFFTVRGFESLNSGLVLTDGAAEPEVSFYHMYNVRRVEVLRGPGAYLYGGNPLSGTVNLVRKQPAPGRFADVRLSGGSFSTFEGQLDANYTRPDGRSSYRLNGLATGSDNYRDDKKSHVFALNPSASWRLGDRTPLSVNLEYARSSFKPDVGLPIVGLQVPADVPRTRSYQSPFDRSEQRLLRLRADFQTSLGRHGTLRDKLYYTDLDWDSDGTLLNGAFPGFPGDFVIVRAMSLLQDRQKLLGNQLEAAWNFGTGGARHSLLVGFEASRLEDDYTLDIALLPVIGLYNNVETAARPLVPIPGLGQKGDTRALVFAPYLADQVSLGDRVQLLAGARFDSLDYEDTVTRTDRRENQWSPMLGVLVSPLRQLSLYANFGKSFAPPSSLVVGERKPERSTQYEAGAKTRLFGGKLLATAAAYQLDKRNVAIPDRTGVTREQGSARSRGLELELQAEVRPDWLVFASYALTDAKLTEFRELVTFSLNPPRFAIFDRSGNRLPFAPRNLFNFWSEREWRGGFGLAAGARYTCTQFIAEDNAFKIKDHWVFDAAVSHKLGPRARLRVNVKNLTGQKYFTRGFSNTAVIPANPFAVYAAIQLGLGSR